MPTNREDADAVRQAGNVVNSLQSDPGNGSSNGSAKVLVHTLPAGVYGMEGRTGGDWLIFRYDAGSLDMGNRHGAPDPDDGMPAATGDRHMTRDAKSARDARKMNLGNRALWDARGRPKSPVVA